jgi:hypothetical protein
VYERSTSFPIVAATSAPRALVIGSDAEAQRMASLLAASGLGPREVALVQGPTSLDQVDTADLAGLSTVIIASTAPTPIGESGALTDWVRAGGRVYVEATEPVSASPMPDPFPITGQVAGEVQGNWNFTTAALPEPFKGSDFGPADWNNTGQWGVQRAVGIKPWASVLLADRLGPLLIEGKFGRGTVVWSGMNLGYHADVANRENEFALWHQLLGVDTDTAQAVAAGTVIDPFSAEIRTSIGHRTVVFAEKYHPGWTATVDGQRSVVTQTAPGFIAVAIDPSMPHRVELTFSDGHLPPTAMWAALIVLGLCLAGALVLPLRLVLSGPGMPAPDEPLTPIDPGELTTVVTPVVIDLRDRPWPPPPTAERVHINQEISV